MKELLYKLLDIATLKKGRKRNFNGLSVRLPTRYMNYFPADYEAFNFRFLQEHVQPGNIVLDIGAHIGLFSCAAASLAGEKGKVFAFEPASKTFQLLKNTIRINKRDDVIIPVQAAMGNTSGKITFYESALAGDNSNSVVPYKVDRKLFQTEVDIFSIDNFVAKYSLNHIEFIKIDAEGAELDVLKGAHFTFTKMKPFIILAIHPEAILSKGDKLETIYELIESYGYLITCHNKKLDKNNFMANRHLIDLHLLPI